MGVLDATHEARAGQCPVCLRVGPLVLDHDHATGLMRGWLCGRCNRGLGAMGDTLAAAERLIAYLRGLVDYAANPPLASEEPAQASIRPATTSEV